MGSYLVGPIIGRIFASEIRGAGGLFQSMGSYSGGRIIGRLFAFLIWRGGAYFGRGLF